MADQAQLIATLSVRMDKFEAQMKDASKQAEKAAGDIEDKFNKANPQIGSIAKGTFLGNIATKAAKELFDIVKELPGQFREIADAAEIAQISISKAFQLTGTLRDFEQAAKLMESIGLSLERIRQGEKNVPLARFLDANGVKIAKDFNGAMDQLATVLQRADAAQLKLAADFLKLDPGVLSRLADPEFTKSMEKNAELAKKFADAWKLVGDVLGQVWLQFKIDVSDVSEAANRFFRDLLIGAANMPFVGESVSASFKKMASGFNVLAEGAAAKAKLLRDELADLKKEAAKDEGEKGGGTLKIPQAEGGESAVERQIRQLEKRREVLDAETATIGLNTQAQAEAKAMAELMTAAKEDEKKGREVNIEKIKEEAAAYAKSVADNAAKQKIFNEALSATAQVGHALGNAFADAVLEGKKLNDVMQSLLKTLARAAINSVFTSLFAKEGLGGLVGNLAVGGKQAGGPVYGGRGYVVGEKGPEVFLPNTSGMIVPNHALGGSGNMNVVISLAGANGDETIKRIAYTATAQGMRAALAQVPQIAQQAVGDHLRRRV